MRNVFKGPWALGVAVVLCGACGSDPEDSSSGGPPPFTGTLPNLPNMPASGPSPGGMQDPSAPVEPPSSPPATPSNETPTAGQDTPLVPPTEMTGVTPTPETPTQPPVTPETPPVVEPEPTLPDGVDPNFMVFLLIGQSNMEGVPPSEQQDRTPNPRVKVLALNNCAQRNQVYNQWYTASPSLHTCAATLGPGDYFGKTMADALPNATIGLVPNAIAGVDIDFFRKGVVSARRNEFRIPPDNQRNSAYDLVIERALLAQKVGVIKGILFHQGESDSGAPGNQTWLGKVQGMVSNLKADLGLADNLPFLAGELLYSPPGCCGGLNTTINRLPGMIPGARVISANGLGNYTGDAGNLHFSTTGQREFGRRYATTMLDALGL